MTEGIYQTDIEGLELLYRGKVRDIYAVSPRRLLIVSTDRVSAFDNVMKTPIVGKGVILAKLASFWFEYIRRELPEINTHYLHGPSSKIVLRSPNSKRIRLSPEINDRAMFVKRVKRIEMECIVRGYITGSAWRDYQRDGKLNGVKLPPGLKYTDKFTKPLFTPSTKASEGHDEPITRAEGEELVGKELYARLEQISLKLYDLAQSYLEPLGLIIADTKFEFGWCNRKPILIDEVFTPDSSRFWWRKEKEDPDDDPQPLDKEYLRSWLIANGKKEAGPIELPNEVIKETYKRYAELHRAVLGNESKKRYDEFKKNIV